MNLSDPFKQLVERRLWPIALLLVAALVAVPVVLKDSESDPIAPLSVESSAGPTGADPDDSVVALADGSKTDDVRSVLGDRKDPFRPAVIDAVPEPEQESTESGGPADDAPAGGGGAEPAGGAPSGGETSEPAPVATPEAPQQTFELYSLVAKFGPAGETQQTKVIERLTGLPGGNPAVLYLGLLKDRKTAAFIVDETVEVTGDGKCLPSPKDCQTLTLKVGETQFFTRGGTSFQLDLKRIITRKTFDAAEAKQAKRAVAKGGQDLLKELGGNDEFEYSEEAGTLARVAKAAKSSPQRRSFEGGALDSSG